MAHGYEVRRLTYFDQSVFILAHKEKPLTWLEKMTDDPQKGNRALSILYALKKIDAYGIGESLNRKKSLREIDSNLSLVEVKAPGKVIRVMAYNHHNNLLVLLFDFDSHQGTSKIKSGVLKRGRELAEIARRCVEVK